MKGALRLFLSPVPETSGQFMNLMKIQINHFRFKVSIACDTERNK